MFLAVSKGVSKSVQVPFNSIEAARVLTLIILKWPALFYLEGQRAW